MKTKFSVFAMAVLLAFGLLVISCGNDNGEAASVEGTTWIANMTRTQMAQGMVEDGFFATVAEAEAFLVQMGVPANFPLARLVFQAPPNLRAYYWDLDDSDSGWQFDGSGTWQQEGNALTATIFGQTFNTNISGRSFTVTVEGLTLTFNRQ